MNAIVPQDSKYCPKCKSYKSPTEFNKDNKRKDGLFLWCRICHQEHGRKYSKSTYDYDKNRNKMLKVNYGITEEEYLEMFIRQGGVCACCGREESVISNKTQSAFRLAVDHDHVTGKVRALLCAACNTSLGAMNEDPERIEALLVYARNLKEN